MPPVELAKAEEHSRSVGAQTEAPEGRLASPSQNRIRATLILMGHQTMLVIFTGNMGARPFGVPSPTNALGPTTLHHQNRTAY